MGKLITRFRIEIIFQQHLICFPHSVKYDTEGSRHTSKVLLAILQKDNDTVFDVSDLKIVAE